MKDRALIVSIVFVVVGLVGVAAVNAQSAKIEVPIDNVSKLENLERKASDYERYRARYNELQKTLDGMLALLGNTEKGRRISVQSGYGKLTELIEQAAQSKTLSIELEELKAQLDLLQRQNKGLKKEADALLAERDKALGEVEARTADAESWKNKNQGLRDTIEQLLLGKFEYYEVKNGETLAGIAANPLVYGDPSRAIWLRQVNENRVRRIENLATGEVLIIPRFPRSGSYEF